MIDVAYIALGSNVGDRHAYLARARAALSTLSRTLIVGESSIEETAPLGPIAQGPYLNQMVAIETALSPHELLADTPGVFVAADRPQIAGAEAERAAGGQHRRDLPAARDEVRRDLQLGVRAGGPRRLRQQVHVIDRAGTQPNHIDQGAGHERPRPELCPAGAGGCLGLASAVSGPAAWPVQKGTAMG